MSITRTLARFFRSQDQTLPLSQIIAGGEFDDAFGITNTAGVKVSKRAALGVAAFFRGVNVISRYVAKTPLVTYRRLEPQGKERAKDHPAYRLLRRQPNPQMTAFTVKQTAIGHVLTHGNAYLFIKRSRDGDPIELWPLLPDRTWPVRINGELYYVTHVAQKGQPADDATDRQITLRGDQVVHIKGLGYDGLVGYNVIRYAAQTLGLAIANREYGAKFYERGGANRVVLETPKTLSPTAAERIIAGWRAMTDKMGNAWRTAILEEDTKAHVISVSARDAQMVDAMKFSAKEIANWLNLPEHMVNGDAKTSYASLEQENQRLLDDAIDPWFCSIEAECEAKLLTEAEQTDESHEISFLRESLIRVNTAERFSTFSIGLQNGFLNVDEVRDWLGLNPLPDGAGQAFRVQMNTMATGGDDTTPAGNADDPTDDDPPADDDPNDDDEQDQQRAREAIVIAAARQALLDALRRMTTRLSTACRKAAAKPREFGGWLDTFARDHALVIRTALRPAIAVGLAVRGNAGDIDRTAADAAAGLCQRMKTLGDQALGYTLDTFAAGVDADLTAAEAAWPEAVAAEIFPSP